MLTIRTILDGCRPTSTSGRTKTSKKTRHLKPLTRVWQAEWAVCPLKEWEDLLELVEWSVFVPLALFAGSLLKHHSFRT
jgi:hypothetical protein